MVRKKSEPEPFLTDEEVSDLQELEKVTKPIKKPSKKQQETVMPVEYEFHGNYALEFMFFRLSEIYYGQKVSLKIESVIKERLE
jgi:hypothetical protein